MRLLAVLLLGMAPLLMSAQLDSDTLDYALRPKWSCDAEKHAYEALFGDHPSAVEAVFAGTYEEPEALMQSSRARIEAVAEGLVRKGIHNKPVKKQAALLLTHTGKAFLQEHAFLAPLESAFTHGKYTSITGAVLLAEVAQAANLPYCLVEMPEGMYLVLDPQGERIVVEPELPEPCPRQVPQDQKQFRVQQMVSTGAVTQAFADSLGVDQAFRALFTYEQDVSLKGWMNYWYSYLANEAWVQGDYEQAWQWGIRAYNLSPVFRTRFLMGAIAETAMDGGNNMSTQDLPWLQRYYAIVPPEELSRMYGGHFGEFAAKYLLRNDDLESYRQVLFAYQQFNTDSALQHDVAFMHNVFNTFYQDQLGNHEIALEHALVAHSLNLQDSLFYERALFDLGYWASREGPDRFDMRLDAALDTLPGLANSPALLPTRCYSLLWKATLAFEDNNASLGEAYLDDALAMRAANEAFTVNDEQVANCITAAWACYVRRSEFKLAARAIDRGLTFNPHHVGLLRMREEMRKEGDY